MADDVDVFRIAQRELSVLERENVSRIKHKAKQLMTVLDYCVHESREQSLAITKLEECVMWAVKGIKK
jgi:hypothetical protein